MIRLVIVFEYFRMFGYSSFNTESKIYVLLRDNLFIGVGAGIMIGLLTGLSELYFFHRYFRNKAFIRLFISKLFIYLTSIIIIAFITVFFYEVNTMNRSVFEAFSRTTSVVYSHSFYHLIVLGGLLSIGINFIIIMKNKLGHSIFIPIIIGKYHQPKEENRIFLFVDLKSSTETAEQLGHKKYSLLIQDCFRDISELVVQYGGGIYQFVGDEVVVTWNAKKKANYLNSVMLFYAYEKCLESRSEFYLKKYGTVPIFKASVNSGKVMVAEVGGSVKTEIAYHGDVLNTAARMIELCNKYNKDFILSDNIIENIDNDSKIHKFSFLGEIQFRGKSNKINIYSANELVN